MRIIVDRSLCDGNGLCAQAAPALLAMDADDVPQVLKEPLDEKDAEQAKRAVKVCPKAALSLIE